MESAIIVSDDGDVMVFETKEDAELYLEAIDVENSEYIAYDSEGRLLELLPAPPHSVLIKDGESNPSHQDQLRSVLKQFLQQVGEPAEPLGQASLAQLVEEALKYRIDVNTRPLNGVRDFLRKLISK